MASLAAVNFVLPRSALAEVDRRRGYVPRSAYLRTAIEERLEQPQDWGHGAPSNEGTTLVTVLLPDAVVRDLHALRGGEPLSGYLRRLVLFHLSRT